MGLIRTIRMYCMPKLLRHRFIFDLPVIPARAERLFFYTLFPLQLNKNYSIIQDLELPVNTAYFAKLVKNRHDIVLDKDKKEV